MAYANKPRILYIGMKFHKHVYGLISVRVATLSYGARRNGRYFAGNIFKIIFLIETCCVVIQISLRCVLVGVINNKSSLLHIMVCHRTGDKPLSEPWMTQIADAYMTSGIMRYMVGDTVWCYKWYNTIKYHMYMCMMPIYDDMINMLKK